MSWLLATGANWHKELKQQGFKLRWRHAPTNELSANMYSSGKVHLIGVFSVGITVEYVRSNQFCKVVHNESGEDFLEDVLHLFALKHTQTNGLFQLAKSCLNSPPKGIEVFQFIQRKGIGIQVGNQGFERILTNGNTNNSKGKRIEFLAFKR